MFLRLLLTCMVSALCCMTALSQAAAQNSTCDPALFKDFKNETSSLAEALAFLQTIDQSNVDNLKDERSGKITLPIEGVPVDFGANWDSFKEKRSHLLNQNQQNYSINEAHALLEQKFSVESTSAYRACLEANARDQIGIHLITTGITDDGLTLTVTYVPSPGTAGTLAVALNINGELKSVDVASNGKVGVELARDPRKNLRIVANGSGFSDNLLIVRVPTIIPVDPIPNCDDQSGGRCLRCKFDVKIDSAHGEYCDQDGSRSCPPGHIVATAGTRDFSCPMPVGRQVLARFDGTIQHDGRIGSCGLELKFNGETLDKDCSKQSANWGERELSPTPDGKAQFAGGIFLCENHLGDDHFNGRGPDSTCTLEGTAWIYTSDAPPPHVPGP